VALNKYPSVLSAKTSNSPALLTLAATLVKARPSSRQTRAPALWSR
jgi:hypothetical protein